ncbi:hypothetical protein [Persephonella sp.]
MYRIVLFVFLIWGVFFKGFSGEEARQVETLILSEISVSLTGKKEGIKVYLTDNMKYIIKYSKILLPVSKCQEADIVIAGKEIKDLECRRKLMVVTKYYLLKEYPNAVAAFYWHKGRPNIVFVYERLKNFGISISEKYIKYVDSEKNL